MRQLIYGTLIVTNFMVANLAIADRLVIEEICTPRGDVFANSPARFDTRCECSGGAPKKLKSERRGERSLTTDAGWVTYIYRNYECPDSQTNSADIELRSGSDNAYKNDIEASGQNSYEGSLENDANNRARRMPFTKSGLGIGLVGTGALVWLAGLAVFTGGGALAVPVGVGLAVCAVASVFVGYSISSDTLDRTWLGIERAVSKITSF